MLLDLGDVAVGELLDSVLLVTALILRELTLLFQLLHLVDAIAADVAKGHLPFFRIFGGQLAELLAPFFGEGRHVDADDLAVVVGGEAQFAHGDRLFNRAQGTDVERLDLDCLGVGG